MSKGRKKSGCSSCGATDQPLSAPPRARCIDWKICEVRRQERAVQYQKTNLTNGHVAMIVAFGLPKKARVFIMMKGREYYLQHVRKKVSAIDGHLIESEHLEWVAEESAGTVWSGAEADKLARDWGAKWREVVKK